ncbi:hypothetical protein [Flavobacterium sp. U410]
METINELEKWMLNNNIKNTFIPDQRYLTDTGEDLEGLYVWYSIDEKGNRTNVEFFKSEKDAVQFVFEYLKNEK